MLNSATGETLKPAIPQKTTLIKQRLQAIKKRDSIRRHLMKKNPIRTLPIRTMGAGY